MTLPGKSTPIVVEPLRLPAPARRDPVREPEPIAPAHEPEPLPEPAPR